MPLHVSIVTALLEYCLNFSHLRYEKSGEIELKDMKGYKSMS